MGLISQIIKLPLLANVDELSTQERRFPENSNKFFIRYKNRWARIKARLHQPAAQNSSNGLKCHLRHASRAIHDIHVEGEMGGGHAKVVLGSPLHSIAMHGAVYRRWQGDLSIYRDGGGGGPAKPTCGVVASSVVDERVSNNGCCGGEGDFGRCDGTGRPGKLTSAFVQMKPRAKLRRRRREGHRALRAELEDNRVLGHRGVEAAARCAVSGNCKSEGARGSIWKLPIEAWQC
ncbi:uncharacterized protein LOC110437084 isoform X2 [Sorghum bicolor]|uniref:uncharacterized protein LOC110437084 isoform X2 n=1 Tax=Sorghum bicolor TaxID=4558 RepID=UPI000B425B6F|nr:uncharacterized protein LOC110437084 isoform X2 [Sorghum bicolor]|eukprot:XP_021320935.1 uncharacterized protein LOC110437084 isoform X2 [Sorghum bicolor]